MQQYNFWEFQVELDEAITKNWYTKSAAWDCDCGYCRNFLALARKNALPASVMEILNKLGIPPEKATYVCGIFSDDGLLYQFSYRIAGNILNEEQIELSAQSSGEGRCCHESYPYGAPNFPEPHFDLEFWLTLPWVLEEALNG